MARDDKGRIVDGTDEGNSFSKDNQPSSESKRQGKKRKRLLKDLAQALVTGDRLEKCKAIAEKVGLDLTDDEYTLELGMTLKQIERAYDEGDTRAYQAAMDRMLGKPKQYVETSEVKQPTPIFKDNGLEDE